jgi:hypothetical protein
MKVPNFKFKLVRIICAGSAAFAGSVLAESPEPGPSKSAMSRTRPQVIYHLPPASNYAATLHSQAKGQNNELPIDSSMPTSLQISRANANAAAAQQLQATPPPVQERHVQLKVRSNRPPIRQRSVIHLPARGNGHGNKSHRK